MSSNKKLSPGEEIFASHLMAYPHLPPHVREFRMLRRRKWRLDFAWPELKVAVEIEGGTFTNGRHTRGRGFADDCLKYNRATINGWAVLRYTTEQVKAGIAIDEVIEILDERMSIHDQLEENRRDFWVLEELRQRIGRLTDEDGWSQK